MSASELSDKTKQAVLKCAEEKLSIDVSNALLREQILKGYVVELEHGTQLKDWRANVTNDAMRETLQIAWAHILEFPDYYDWLEKMEDSAKVYWESQDVSKEKLALAAHVAKHGEKHCARFGDGL